ncbi:hypothetical protein [Halosimplex halobium]|uniref:hypothetical protein n=1 Tax=Halosimplex halobium TaxID=3396618 RepID=UPI003F542862
MTSVIEENAPSRARGEVEKLHQLAVNEFGYHTDHVLFTAHEDGTIKRRIALDVATEFYEEERGSTYNSTKGGEDFDPDPPAIGVGASPSDASPAVAESEV